MRSRIVLVSSILVAVLLLGTVVYSGALANPYSGFSPSYAVANESSDGFEQTVAEEDLEPDAATPVDDLSPETQRVFEEAKTEPPTGNDSQKGSGWKQLGSVPVCGEEMLVCDEYDERPEFSPDGGAAHEQYDLVDDDGTLYVVETAQWPVWSFNFFALVAKTVAFGPYALFLVWTASSHSRVPDRHVAGFVGFGLLLVAGSLAYPYVVMFTGLSTSITQLLVIVGLVWLVMAVGGWSEVRQFETDDPAE